MARQTAQDSIKKFLEKVKNMRMNEKQKKKALQIYNKYRYPYKDDFKMDSFSFWNTVNGIMEALGWKSIERESFVEKWVIDRDHEFTKHPKDEGKTKKWVFC